MIRIIFRSNIYTNYINIMNKNLGNDLSKSQYGSEFLPNYELTCHRSNQLKKISGIRFHAYKNYGLSRKNRKNDIKNTNPEFSKFLFGDKIKSK